MSTIAETVIHEFPFHLGYIMGAITLPDMLEHLRVLGVTDKEIEDLKIAARAIAERMYTR